MYEVILYFHVTSNIYELFIHMYKYNYYNIIIINIRKLQSDLKEKNLR